MIDKNYLYHLWINDQTGQKTCCDQIISGATSVILCPDLAEAIDSVIYLANNPQEEEECEEGEEMVAFDPEEGNDYQ